MGNVILGVIRPMPKSKNEYLINNVSYKVSSKFINSIFGDFASKKFENYIKSDFAHLTEETNIDILSGEYICQTANKKGA